MRNPTISVAIVPNRIMGVVPPPADLLGAENLLSGIILVARLGLPIARWQTDDEAGSVRVESYRSVGPGPAVKIEPIEILPALDPRLDVGQAVDRRLAGQPEAVKGRRIRGTVDRRPRI